jgi:hypothetical protein
MKGRNQFTSEEAKEIVTLIRQKLESNSSEQKSIRNKIRRIGFYASDFGLRNGYTAEDFLRVVTITGKSMSENVQNDLSFISKKLSPTSKLRQNSDEAYIIDLCDDILDIKANRQATFPFLLGDPNKNGVRKRLPVDAWYSSLNLVVEYYERQHTEEVAFFNRRPTLSGVNRGEQRNIYDNRRKEELRKHNIKLLIISYSDFEYSSSRKIIRNKERDRRIIGSLLKNKV